MLELNFETTGQFAVKVDLTFPQAMTAVFGPSGSGKSTMLRTVAGLEPTRGTIRFNGDEWLNSAQRVNVKPNRRAIGYVRQNASLFPHLSIQKNLSYPIRHSLRRGSEFEFEQVVADFELSDLLPRKPHEISGGETQRIALARALLSQPRLLLLDEPLTGLDMQRKAEILPFLESMLSAYDIPTLYVSHAVDEVTVVCPHTVVMAGGRIRAQGPTSEMLERRDLDEVLGDIDSSSLVKARVTAFDARYDLTELQVEDRVWSVPIHVQAPRGSSLILRVRARDVALATIEPTAISTRNTLYGKLVEIDAKESGPSVDCIVQTGSTRLRARITRASLDQLGLHIGDSVYALVKSVTLT